MFLSFLFLAGASSLSLLLFHYDLPSVVDVDALRGGGRSAPAVGRTENVKIFHEILTFHSCDSSISRSTKIAVFDGVLTMSETESGAATRQKTALCPAK